MHYRSPLAELPLISPPQAPDEMFSEAEAAVAALQARYDAATGFLRRHFAAVMAGEVPAGRYRAFYPQVSLTTASFAKVDSRLSFGHVTEPGLYATTITRPHLFEGYLIEQIGLLIQNHGMPVRVGTSDTPIPLHFAMGEDAHVEGSIEDALHRPLRDLFDVPDLNTTDDHIVNGDRPDRAGRARGRWRRSPRSGSTIRWRGSRTTRRRARRISRTTCSSPTTSSTWTSSWSSRRARSRIRAPATRASWGPATS